VNDEKNPGIGQSRSYHSVNLQQNALHPVTSRRRRDGDSSASPQSSLPSKAAISIMSIPSWVHPKKVMDHAALRSDRRSQKS